MQFSSKYFLFSLWLFSSAVIVNIVHNCQAHKVILGYHIKDALDIQQQTFYLFNCRAISGMLLVLLLQVWGACALLM